MKRLRIGYARINQESNAFSPLPTTLDDFERMHMLEGAELAEACRPFRSEAPGLTPIGELTGFCHALRNEDVELVPLLSAWAMPSGPMDEATYLALRARLLDSLEKAGELDGVYLALHGSMRARGAVQEPEEGFIEAVRSAIGDRPLAVSYDLHGLMTRTKVEVPDIVTAYRTNPHRDLPQIGGRTGRLLLRTIRGEIHPVKTWRSLPIALGGGLEVDFLEPMRGIFRRMKEMEKDERVLFPSLFMVHPFTDASHLGWSIVTMTDDDVGLAERLADELAERCWSVRDVAAPAVLEPAGLLERVRGARWARRLGSVFVTDVCDVVGAGGVGDNPNLLRFLRDEAADLISYVPVRDPAVVERLWSLSEGAQTSIEVGGRLASQHGAPCALTGVVGARRTHDKTGRAIAFDAGHVKVVITDGPPFTLGPGFFQDLGLPLRKADMVVMKSFFHFRIFHIPWVRLHLGVRTRGTTDLDLYRTVKHDAPIHPRDRIADWRDTDRQRRAPV